METMTHPAATPATPSAAASPTPALWTAPGGGNAPGTARGAWQPCGHADGVIFLGDLHGDGGYERQALRYLRPAAAHPEAALYVKKHCVTTGISDNSSNAAFLLQRHPEIFEAAKASGRKIEPFFCPTEAGRHINQPQYRDRWSVQKVEEGVWAVKLA